MHAFLRRLALTALTLGVMSAPAWAQASEDDYDFSEIPVEEEEIPYIGVGGGYQLQMTLLNLDKVNELARSLSMPEHSGALFMHGGGGWTAIGIIPNVRLGVFGAGGSKEVESTDTSGGGRYRRTLEISNGITAALVDYAFTPFSRFTVAPGLMIGGGSMTVEYTRTSETTTFGTFFDPATLGGGAGAEANRQASMTRTYVHLAPMVNVEYAMTQFILLRLGGGYSFSFGETWSDRHGTEIAGVPDEINADGPTFQVGLFLGLFQQ